MTGYDDQPAYRQGYIRPPGERSMTPHEHLAETRRVLAEAERRAASAAEARAHGRRQPVEAETPGYEIVKAAAVEPGDWVWFDDRQLWGQVVAIEPAPEGLLGWSWTDHRAAEGVSQAAADADVYAIRSDR